MKLLTGLLVLVMILAIILAIIYSIGWVILKLNNLVSSDKEDTCYGNCFAVGSVFTLGITAAYFIGKLAIGLGKAIIG